MCTNSGGNTFFRNVGDRSPGEGISVTSQRIVNLNYTSVKKPQNVPNFCKEIDSCGQVVTSSAQLPGRSMVWLLPLWWLTKVGSTWFP